MKNQMKGSSVNFNLSSNKKWSNQDYFKGCYPIVNYTRRTDDFIVEVLVPGFKMDEFTINIDYGLLNIEGKQIYSDSHFIKNITLPPNVDLKNYLSQINNGYIKVIFPFLSKS